MYPGNTHCKFTHGTAVNQCTRVTYTANLPQVKEKFTAELFVVKITCTSHLVCVKVTFTAKVCLVNIMYTATLYLVNIMYTATLYLTQLTPVLPHVRHASSSPVVKQATRLLQYSTANIYLL